MKVKAFGYVRVSGKSQIDKDGPVRQEKAIRDYAKHNGIEVVRIFKEEGVSGTIQDRPALQEMLFVLTRNGDAIRTVLIEKMDRLARDLMVQEVIVDDLKTRGFSLISVTEGDDLLSEDPTRKLVRQVLGAIAEYDKTMIVLKLRAARDRKRIREGKCEGRKSYSEAAPAVLDEIKRLRRKPKGGRRKTFESIAAELNEKGFTTTSGLPFTGNNVAVILHRVKR